MVDAVDLKSIDRKVVGVQVPPWAPFIYVLYFPEKKAVLMAAFFFTQLQKEKWRDPDLNRGHKDFQSSALPTELSRRI